MRSVVYPGTFNPIHEGHLEIITKLSDMFDRVIVAVGINPDKEGVLSVTQVQKTLQDYPRNVVVGSFKGLLVDYVNSLKSDNIVAVARGLRNNQDFEFEKTQQYWNEDLGLLISTIYVIASRDKIHISSSAIRMINKIKDNK
jgi:pantetheine-phosphate adenylyltransferase